MLSREQNELITRTGPDTPLGRLMRRYWIPALLTEEIPAPDCPPVQVRLLGEELVAFRDSQGRVGLLAEACSHRGTSLFYGRNEECGLRCIYHGWKYDVAGNVVDTPAEPAGSVFKFKLRHTAYPTHEAAGIVWAYLGAADKKPLFPNYAYALVAPERTFVTKSLLECNYLQGLEGECDSSHLSFLHREFHGEGLQRFYQADTAPEYYTEDTDFGVRLVALRHPNSGETYVRVSSFVMPIGCWIPAGHRKEIHMYVPLDDARAWRYDLVFNRERPIEDAERYRRTMIEPDHRRVRRKDNHYLQDREAQRTRDFTGIDGFFNEDACATETMGAIYDRSREHLGQSDKGVIAVRRFILDAIKAHESGQEAPHVVYDAAANDMSHIDTLADVIPSDRHWREHFPHLTVESPRKRALASVP